MRPSPASHLRAFVQTVTGTGDVPDDDPHRTAKRLGIAVSFALFVVSLASAVSAVSTLRGRRTPRRSRQ